MIDCINPLNEKLNPICHVLALLGAHFILHISKIRVNHTCIAQCSMSQIIHISKKKCSIFTATPTDREELSSPRVWECQNLLLNGI